MAKQHFCLSVEKYLMIREGSEQRKCFSTQEDKRLIFCAAIYMYVNTMQKSH